MEKRDKSYTFKSNYTFTKSLLVYNNIKKWPIIIKNSFFIITLYYYYNTNVIDFNIS